MTIDAMMRLSPVIPVLVIDDVADAVPIAEALVGGGLPMLEVTLRTPAALAVMREMASVDGAIIGAGTVLNERDLDAALEAGAQFIVSPGLTDPLAAACRSCPELPMQATSCAALTLVWNVSNFSRPRPRVVGIHNPIYAPSKLRSGN